MTRSECRKHARYKLAIELQFSWRRGDRTHFGSGRTRDFSEGVICFESDGEVPASAQPELILAWPELLQGVHSIEAIVRGKVIRNQQRIVVLRANLWEFRTCGKAAFYSPPDRGTLLSILA